MQLQASRAAHVAQSAELGSLRDEVGTLQQVLGEEAGLGKGLRQEVRSSVWGSGDEWGCVSQLACC